MRRSRGLAKRVGGQQVRQFVGARSWRRVVLTGMGSSYHTLHPINLALIEAGLNPVMMETSELVHYGVPLLR